MKALTIQQPWIDAIVQPGDRPKRTENRSWMPPPALIGQRILLHAGKTADRRAVLCRGRDWPDQRGVILAAATITGHHLANITGPLCCAPWGFPDAWHWDIADDVIRLAQPVPAKGALGFWTPPADVLAAVQQQLDQLVTT